MEIQDGIRVYQPRFFSVPSLFKSLDGLFMALGSYATLRRIKREFGCDVLDAHFGYPDGYAAALLGRWLDVPVTITLRGTEVPHSRQLRLRALLTSALKKAARIFSVSESLREHAISLGIAPGKIRVVGNGVDTDTFAALDKREARLKYGLPRDAKVLVSVGALVERKGFHRVIGILPALMRSHPTLHYLVVGGASPEGNLETELRHQVAELGLEQRVRFLGALPPEELKWPLSAADVFVLATRNEGWANVFLEAMACGLPVVTTDVGGNREVVCSPALGQVVPYGDAEALRRALATALDRQWGREKIRAHALENAWDSRVDTLVDEFQALLRTDACNSPSGLRAYGGGQR
jgi:glycosyltransferase involved in cell wall biosynthesis